MKRFALVLALSALASFPARGADAPLPRMTPRPWRPEKPVA